MVPEVPGDLAAKVVGIVAWAGGGRRDPLSTVGVEDGRIEDQPPPASRAQAARGIMQPPSSSARTRRSATHGAVGCRVVQGGQQARVAASSARHSMPSAPCPTAGRKAGGREPLRDVPVEPQPAEPGLGEDHRVEPAVERLVQPRLDVPPDGDDLQVGPGVEQLRPSAQRAGADRAPAGRASRVR